MLLQEFDMQILDRSEIKDTKVDNSLMEAMVLEELIGKSCIPYGTVVSLDGIAHRTFGNTELPKDHIVTPPPTLEVQKVHYFDESNYHDNLPQNKLARIELSTCL